MPEPTPAPTPSPDPKKKIKRSSFNKAQLEDIEQAEDVLAAAMTEPRLTELKSEEGFTDAWLAEFKTLLEQSRGSSTATQEAHEGLPNRRINATGAELKLLEALHKIQSKAKGKARKDSSFTTDGYLIGQRLNQSRTLLVQNTVSLRAKAAADSLPGFGAVQLAELDNLSQAYRDATKSQADSKEEAGSDRVQRDAYITKVNNGRIALQHGIDSLHPYTVEASAPIRSKFGLPAHRPMTE